MTDIEIVALGARSPVGATAEGTAAAIRAGISRLILHPVLLDPTGEDLRCGCDRGLDAEFVAAARMTELARLALADLSRNVGEGFGSRSVVPLILGLPEIRPGFDEHDAEQIAEALALDDSGARLPYRVHTVLKGHAAMFHALQVGIARLRAGECDFCIVGAVESYLDTDTIEWLDGERRLARDGIRTGFPPGEGAAFVMLATSKARARHGYPKLARLRDVGCATEKRLLDSDTGSLGAGLTEAVRVARGSLQQNEQITDVFGDLNGERHRSEDWGFTLLRCPKLCRDGSDVTTAVGSCGDLGAATGALQCVLAIRAWARSYAKDPRALLFAGSWGGLRGAAVLERGETWARSR